MVHHGETTLHGVDLSMKEELIVSLVCAVVGSQALLEIIKAIIQSYKEKTKKPSAMEDGIRWLQQDKLEYLATREIQKGETSRQMKSFLHRGYNIYHALGGNGDMKELMDTYDELPVKY